MIFVPKALSCQLSVPAATLDAAFEVLIFSVQ